MKRLFPAFLLSAFLLPNLNAQNSSAGWTTNFEPEKVFTENKGQFHIHNSNEEVLFAYDNGGTMVYFTKKGVTYSFLKLWKKEADEREKARESKEKFAGIEEWRKKEDEERRMESKSDAVSFTWENANPGVELGAENEVGSYSTYTLKDESGNNKNINYAKGFKKLTYKNVYPGIDVEYVFHPEDGLKYSFILQPGADISLVKMNYSDGVKLNGNGDLSIRTLFGDIIDHAPVTFYSGNTSEVISSKFIKDGKTISFELGAYNHSRTIVVDPWTQTPTLSASNGVWECEKDGAGNVYIIGGETPLKLLKYNSVGTLQWTHSTPYDTINGDWLGTFATDLAGNSYVTNGSTAELQKVNNAGATVYSVTGGSNDEYWNIAFNCDQTKLIIGGTRLIFSGASISGSGVIFDINTATGGVNSIKTVGYTTPGAFGIQNPDEVRSITSSRNARYYYLTLDSMGCIDQNFAGCGNASSLFKRNSTYALGYKCETYRPNNGNGGIMAIRANGNFVYTQNGGTVQKRSLATGAVITSAAIPGGSSSASFGYNSVNNSGLDIDSCGNVYVGSGNAVIKYDANLNQLSSSATVFTVYDVTVSYGGNVIAAGAIGNNSQTSRPGYVQQINMAACNPMVLFCCDATICPPVTHCVTDAPFNLTTITAGGTFSGTGITNTASGTFSPAIAGVGSFYIKYTLACGIDSVLVTVNSCGALSACSEVNGNITVSAGTGTYTWYHQVTGPGPCVPGAGFCSGFGTVAGPNITTWQSYQTGSSNPPGATYPIYIIDAVGDSIYIPSFASLPSCSSCAMTGSVSSQTNVTCNGGNNGSATVSQTGGSGSITYSWAPSGGTAATATNLTAQVYTVTISASGCTVTVNVTITQPPAVTSSVSSQTNVLCNGASTGAATVAGGGGNGTYSYSWAPSGGNAATASGLAANTYTCTVTSGGCPTTQTVTITQPPSITTTTASVNASCGSSNGSATVNASGGTGTLTYSWNPGGQTAATATALAGGTTYTCTITDANACTSTVTVAVVSAGAPTANISSQTNILCNGASTGAATVNASGGSGTYTYSWAPSGGTAASASGLAMGVYTITVNDGSCITTQTVSITQPPPIATPTSSVNSNCGGNTGSATCNATGGSGTLNYSWNPGGQTTSTATALASGTYTCTITDANACTATVTVVVNSNGGPTVSLSSQTNVSCNGGTNGAATISASGGTGTLTYNWLPSGGTAVTASGLAANTYTCSVTDGAGCVQSQTVTITSPPVITTTTTSVNAACGTPNGSATVNASGGTGVLTYSWNPGGQTTATATALAANTYTCTITDANACTQTVSVVVGSNGGPTALASGNGPICAGQTIALTSSGGVSYSWAGPNSYSNPTQNPTIAASTTAASGIYTVTVTDAGGCTNTATVSVVVNPSPTPTASVTTSPICAGGTINLNSSGGTSYSWSGPNSYSNATQNPSITNATTAASGTYTVTVTTGTCSATATTSVTVNALPVGTATSNGPVCAGSTINLTGGGGGTYSWSGPNGFSSGVQNPTIPNATAANAGTYSVTVTGVNTCTATATVNVGIGAVTSQTVAASFCQGLNYTLPGGTQVTTAGTYVDTIPSFAGCDSIITTNLTINAGPVVGIAESPNDTISLSQSVTLTASGATTYVWDNASTATSIVVTPAAIGNYTVCVYGTSGAGCIDSQCVNIYVKKFDCGVLFVPTAFSPNGDYANDQLCIYGGGANCVQSLQFRIYDRWGEKVFETTDPNFCWDGTYNGKALNSAVFAFYLNATMLDNTQVEQHGNVSLIK